MFWNLPNMGKNKMMMVGEMGPAASASQQEPDSGSRADGKQSTDTMGSAPTPSDSASEQQPIWTWSQFSKPPSNGKDEWIVQYMHLGYLIRRHGKVRKKAFHPIHRSCPVDGSLLDTERVALIFPLHETSRRVSQDAWTDTKGWSVEDGWRGYTFIKLRDTDLASESRSNCNLDGFEVVSHWISNVDSLSIEEKVFSRYITSVLQFWDIYMRPLGPHYNVFFDVAEALCLEYVFVVAACGPLGRRTKPHVLIVRTKNKDCFKSTFNIQTTLPKTQDI